MNQHFARFALDEQPLTRIFVKRLALVLERRMHGWHLLYAARQLRTSDTQLIGGHRHRHARQHFALGVGRAGTNAELDGGAVSLVGVQADLRELGGRTKAQRQEARCERIKRAGVARFFGAIEPFGTLQRVVARKAQRLVQQQHAVHSAPRQSGRSGGGWRGDTGQGRCLRFNHLLPAWHWPD